MDGSRFDDLTRKLGAARSRRTLLRTTAAGLAALFGGRFASVDAASRCRSDGNACEKNGDCCSSNCAATNRRGRRLCCGAGSQICNDVCTSAASFQSDPNNCGSCGHSCAGGTCTAGVCCLLTGATCAFTGEGECCVGACIQGVGICGFIPTGQLCTPGHDAECSSGSCRPFDVGSFCDPNGAGGTCRVNDDCVTALCQSGVCACAPASGSCGTAADCCNRPCYNGVCQFIPTGQICLPGHDADCASGTCVPVDTGYVCG